MNKLSANFSLYAITFFAAVQYVFLANVPDSVSTFAFLTVTNIFGFVITFFVFSGELRRLDLKQIRQSIILSFELLMFNVFLVLGSRGVGAIVTACVLSTYFVFIVIFSRILFREKPDKQKIVGIVVVLIGVFLLMDANLLGITNLNVIFLILADAFFALYLLTVEKYAESSNPSILAMGQTFFNFMFALVFWVGESVIFGDRLYLPMDQKFWGSVFFISFFIRGLYGIVQVYAQRYVSPFNVSLIFSTEIIMTIFISPVLAKMLGETPEKITPLRVSGAVIMMVGIMLSDPAITDKFRREKDAGKK